MSADDLQEYTYTDTFHGFKREVTLVLNKESKVVQMLVDFPIGAGPRPIRPAGSRPAGTAAVGRRGPDHRRGDENHRAPRPSAVLRPVRRLPNQQEQKGRRTPNQQEKGGR